MFTAQNRFNEQVVEETLFAHFNPALIISKGLLTEKVRRALENRRYQEKRKSATLVQPQVKKKKNSEASSEGKKSVCSNDEV